jgi:hypothetical protein
MRQRVTWVLMVVTVVAGSAFADDRLAVFEMFGRKVCGNCNAAGEVVTVLQEELRGQAVLLEYDYDLFPYGRLDRFWATGVSAYYLPLMMVGSGYRTSSGVVDFDAVYRGMIDDELARAPRAAVTAYWRRAGNSMRAYVDVRNLGPTDLEVRRDAGIWLIAYENADIGNTGTWVQSTSVWYLPYDLEPGEQLTTVIDTPSVFGVDWARVAGLVMVDDQLPGSDAYDMVQAAEALPAGLSVSPDRLLLSAAGSSASIDLAGPHVLSWSASSDVPWLDLAPDSGSVPASMTLSLRPELRPPTATAGTVTFVATGDDMSFSTTVSVLVGAQHRRAAGRLRPLP